MLVDPAAGLVRSVDPPTRANRSGTSFDENYSYDAAGNRLSFSNGIISRTYTIDPNNQLYSDGVNTYLYDAEGNRIRRTQISTGNYVEYHYDHRNRLTEELFKDSGGNTTRTVEYTYDAFDRLDELTGTGMNGINLSVNCLHGKLLAKLASRLSHQSILLRAAFEDTWFVAPWAARIDEQFQFRCVFAR